MKSGKDGYHDCIWKLYPKSCFSTLTKVNISAYKFNGIHTRQFVMARKSFQYYHEFKIKHSQIPGVSLEIPFDWYRTSDQFLPRRLELYHNIHIQVYFNRAHQIGDKHDYRKGTKWMAERPMEIYACISVLGYHLHNQRDHNFAPQLIKSSIVLFDTCN